MTLIFHLIKIQRVIIKKRYQKRKIKSLLQKRTKNESEMKNPNQDGEELGELKEAVKEQEHELGAKNEVAGKPETRALPSNTDKDESEVLKERAM